MRSGFHFVDWQGRRYTAEPLKSQYRVTTLPPVWAVSRGREFIGTMPCRPERLRRSLRCAASTGYATSTVRGERSGVGLNRPGSPQAPGGSWRFRGGDARAAARANADTRAQIEAAGRSRYIPGRGARRGSGTVSGIVEIPYTNHASADIAI